MSSVLRFHVDLDFEEDLSMDTKEISSIQEEIRVATKLALSKETARRAKVARTNCHWHYGNSGCSTCTEWRYDGHGG